MDAEHALREGRRAAEALMVDECRVWLEDGTETTDPYTGEVVFGRSLVYEGPCKVQSQTAWETEPTSAGARFTLQSYEVHVPVGVGPVMVGHLVEPTVCQNDPHLVGRWFRVRASFHKSFATAQRVGIVEVTG